MSETVRAGEAGVIRLYRVNGEMTVDEVAGALGTGPLAESHVEVIRPGDLQGVGLSRYLIDGVGAEAAEVMPMAGQLDAVSGPVVMVLSKAFGGERREIAAGDRLEPLARFGEAAPQTPEEPVTTASAKGPIVAGTPPEGIGRSRGWQAVVGIVLVLLVALVLILVR